jgi:hypothetical protein
MAPPKLVGILVDQYGHEADIWYYTDDKHIVIMIGDSQDGDFVVNQPCLLDPQQVRAHEAYQSWQSTGSVERFTLSTLDNNDEIDDNDVIEPFESLKTSTLKYAH